MNDMEIASEFATEVQHEVNADTEMIEVTDIWADLPADKWIAWVDKRPRKNSDTAQYICTLIGTPTLTQLKQCSMMITPMQIDLLGKSFTI